MHRLITIFVAVGFSGCTWATKPSSGPSIPQLMQAKYSRCLFVRDGDSRGIRLEPGGSVSYVIFPKSASPRSADDLAAQFVASGACRAFVEEGR